MIYAYHPDDPTSEDSIPGHSVANRGVRSVMLLNSRRETPALLGNLTSFDIASNKVRSFLSSRLRACAGKS